MLGLAIALPIIGAYIMTSVVLLNFPLLLHKKKQVKFRCRHISHRGGAAENLENTMTAYRHALNMGTEMLELDVHLTADQQVVVCHDDDLSRVTDTELKISDLKYKDLPPLMRTLRVQFQPGTHHLICKYNRRDLTVWGNFSKEVTDKCFKKDPEIPIMFSMQRTALLIFLFYSGLLPFVPLRESLLEIMLPVTMIRRFEVSTTMKIMCYVVDWLLISPILFKHLDKRGIQTYLWVLNEDSEFNLAFNKLKVAGVMTDYPTRLKNYLDGGNGPPPANSSSSNEASQLIKQK
ncbi:PREDICTED: glycerophosphodiester phosphodiesterase domain-containing protein 1-like [Acropora digitifera]|uniref:glycerophosphodiester phosphodiesterase domain-containing protein 1-like n=1 Tax=Acropora digitifera TaxID=70779 RepID=UPI00077AD0D1|nr:PREDICTED: glycerophosphodiester phosphodiesterase domain-containing protein 1-like [Acropora digitifera]